MKVPPTLRILLCTVPLLAGCKSTDLARSGHFSHFTGLTDFSSFAPTRDDQGNQVLLSPTVPSPRPWNQLIVSWNAAAASGSLLTVEAAGIFPNGRTKFYTLAKWSPDAQASPRTSMWGQGDADGTVNTDTLVLNRLASGAQIRLTLVGATGTPPALKFLGLSFCDTMAATARRPSNRLARGTTIATPERSQRGYAGNQGWCSPASLSMILARWAVVLNRPELDLPVPLVAAAVYDQAYQGTGNWTFNTAVAGGVTGMRGYVTRFDDLSEVEDWIAAGIPVVLSARWDLLQPGRPADAEGHLIVCVGFTKNGDVVVNDPAARLDLGERIRCVYRRENVIRAWASSHNTVYLIYPDDARIPRNLYGHW